MNQNQNRERGRHQSKRNKKKPNNKRLPRPAPQIPSDPESTGEEAAYLKTLVDQATPVVVVLKSGEQLRGQLRYYDRDVFSLGPSDGGPKLLLRKTSIRYLYEDAG